VGQNDRGGRAGVAREEESEQLSLGRGAAALGESSGRAGQSSRGGRDGAGSAELGPRGSGGSLGRGIAARGKWAEPGDWG
jgi:hypothetical protein